MSLLDIIKNLFNNNKINTHVYCEDLHKIKGETTPLSVVLTDKNGNLLANKPVDIEINNVKYTRITDENGIARLNINLNVDSYPVGVSFKGDDEYNKSTGYCRVFVTPKITVNNLNMKYSDGSKFTAKLTDIDDNPLQGINVLFKVNGASYNRATNNEGIASLNINLNPGDYNILTYAVDAVNSTIHIDKGATRMEGTDINKTFSEKVAYQCAVYDVNNNRVPGVVKITVNGKTYPRTPDAEGLYKLNINLNPGTYTIKAEFSEDSIHESCSVVNKIIVNPDPAPAQEPVKLYPYLTSPGGGKLGQRTGYSCGPHSLMQAIYRLTGIELSETELMSVCGTTTSGTGHYGLATGLAWFNRKYAYNLKMTWKNFSEVGFAGLQQYYENGAVFLHLCYRSTWGHYEVPLTSSTDPNKILNSLGNQCGNGYCGYIESRSKSTQQSYINGISQKSVCIITKG